LSSKVSTTGPSGHIGSVVAPELIAAGHDVIGLRSSVVRLAPTVHGPEDHHGFVPRLIGIARDTGVSGYVGDGANRWPALHEVDAARLYRLALEAAPPRTRLHGAAEEGIPVRDIAEAIGRRLNVPTASIPPGDEAMAHYFS
jgi:nucleoside-diphosphate-sugar epimerase